MCPGFFFFWCDCIEIAYNNSFVFFPSVYLIDRSVFSLFSLVLEWTGKEGIHHPNPSVVCLSSLCQGYHVGTFSPARRGAVLFASCIPLSSTNACGAPAPPWSKEDGEVVEEGARRGPCWKTREGRLGGWVGSCGPLSLQCVGVKVAPAQFIVSNDSRRMH